MVIAARRHGADARLPGDRAGARHPRHVPRRARRADRAERHRASGRRRSRLGGRPGRGAPAVRAASARRRGRARHPAGAGRFVVDEYRSRSIAGDSARLALFPASRASFLPDGAPARAGSVLRQPDLAATLEAIRDHGADGFYRGRVADLIVAEMERGGGLISHEDLAAYRAIWRDPITISYRRPHHLLDAAGLVRRRHDGRDPQHHGGLRPAPAVRLPRADAPRGGGDAPGVHRPQHATSATRRSSATRPTGCSRRPTPPSSGRASGERASPTPAFAPGARTGSSTTHYSVVDQEGNAVSCTTTLNDSYGSAVTVTGAGFLLNDEMDDFATAPGQAEHVRPGPGRGQRHRSRQAHALGHDAEHRAGSRRAGCCWWSERRADRGSSRWSITSSPT